MKLASRFLLVLVTVALAAAAGAIVLHGAPVEAQLGNAGVPVHCGVYVFGAAQFLTCKAADGTVFTTGSTRVPSGYYLLVTDIIIAPNSTADTQAIISSVDGNDADAGDGVLIQTATFGSQGQHFTSPALVLPAQYRLKALDVKQNGFIVGVNGLLTRNLTYTPLIVR